MNYDYLVVGQGLCGTWLSYYFLKANKKVLVIDAPQANMASRVASGVINPVTGRRIVRTWRIEELLPFATNAYRQFGEDVGAEISWTTSILNFHPSPQMQEAFIDRMKEETEYLHPYAHEDEWHNQLNFSYGINEVAPALVVDLQTLLDRWRQKLEEKGALLSEQFTFENCSITHDMVAYKDVTAQKIFFCDGFSGFTNPLFHKLPYTANKGEALIVSIPGLAGRHIIKHKYSIVPWKDDLYWVGSNYQWSFEDVFPTPEFRQQCESYLKQFLKVPFTVVEHVAAVRPANIERRPFVGLHPDQKAAGVLNGMGTKGCSLAPFFANQLVQHVLYGLAIYPDADIARFKNIFKRKIDI
jgi:glycine/D-amino acid oxidase-like deaminating enzyme